MNALVVGHGRMGGFHRKALADLGYDVTTVDPTPGLADHVKVPARSFDVVCIATPIPHLAECAAEWDGFDGYLLIEKPMATTFALASALEQALRGVDVAVGYVERFNPCVRRLRVELAGRRTRGARFVRWSTRPSSDVALDLMTHDLDLTAHLGVCGGVVEYDPRADAPAMRRYIAVECADGATLRAHLTAHDTSPLHAQWHAFLSGRGDTRPATMEDAAWTLAALQSRQIPVAA
jgi:hypothetical protein